MLFRLLVWNVSLRYEIIIIKQITNNENSERK